MNEHSPGPWAYDGPEDSIHVEGQPHLRVCFLTSDGPTEAHARLIAAAPELLAELKRSVSCLQAFVSEHVDPGTEALAAIHCAQKIIAKAQSVR